MSWGRGFPKSKYGAKRTKHAGYSFASKMEASRFTELELLKRAGEISEIQVQAQVVLTEASIIYKPDFKITYPDGHVEWEEVKGFETDAWKIKKRLWRFYGPGILKIFMGQGGRLFLAETIEGRGNKWICTKCTNVIE